MGIYIIAIMIKMNNNNNNIMMMIIILKKCNSSPNLLVGILKIDDLNNIKIDKEQNEKSKLKELELKWNGIY